MRIEELPVMLNLEDDDMRPTGYIKIIPTSEGAVFIVSLITERLIRMNRDDDSGFTIIIDGESYRVLALGTASGGVKNLKIEILENNNKRSVYRATFLLDPIIEPPFDLRFKGERISLS